MRALNKKAIRNLSLSSDKPKISREDLGKFFKFHLAAALATGVDFSVFYILFYFSDLSAEVCTFTGASVGAVLNYSLSSTFVFRNHGYNTARTATRYAVVAIGSAFLNSLCVGLLIRSHFFYPAATRPLASLLVSLFYNFPLHRWFVFR